MSFDELRRGAIASYAISRWIDFTTLVAMEEYNKVLKNALEVL